MSVTLPTAQERARIIPGRKVWNDAYGEGTVRASGTDSVLVQFGEAQRCLGWHEINLMDETLLLAGQAAPAPDDLPRGIEPPEGRLVVSRVRGGLYRLPLNDVQANPLNPRRVDDQDVQDLADDIRLNGQINPVTVRELAGACGPPHYEIISGERRYRACLAAGVETLLALNRGAISAEEAYAETVRENAQRSQLNCLEEARAVGQMRGWGWEEARIGQLLGGRSQAWVSRTASLLCLPGPVQDLVHRSRLSRSHAEELLILARWPKALVDLAQEAAEKGWPVSALASMAKSRREAFEEKERLPSLDLDVPPPVAAQPPDGQTWPAATPITDPGSLSSGSIVENNTHGIIYHLDQWDAERKVWRARIIHTGRAQVTDVFRSGGLSEIREGRMVGSYLLLDRRPTAEELQARYGPDQMPQTARAPAAVETERPAESEAAPLCASCGTRPRGESGYCDYCDPAVQPDESEPQSNEIAAPAPTEAAAQSNSGQTTEAAAPLAAAAAPAAETPTPEPEKKPGFLKSAEEIAAGKAARRPRPAAPAPPLPPPLLLPPADLARIQQAGLGTLSAVRLACEVAELAKEFTWNGPADAVAALRDFSALLRRKQISEAVALARLESWPEGAPEDPGLRAREEDSGAQAEAESEAGDG